MANVSDLIGKKVLSVVNRGDEVIFTIEGGDIYEMNHQQQCCENVWLEDIIGDLSDLEDVILDAKEVEGSGPDEYTYFSESHSWTFYDFRTRKGNVTLRWLGESNGHYSEEVSFKKSWTSCFNI